MGLVQGASQTSQSVVDMNGASQHAEPECGEDTHGVLLFDPKDTRGVHALSAQLAAKYQLSSPPTLVYRRRTWWSRLLRLA